MSWITEIAPDQAEGRLKTIFDELSAKRGKIANILRVHSLHAEALSAHMNLYMVLLFGPGGLSRKQREMVAVVVSRANRCEYCVAHHAEALSHYIRDDAVLQAFSRDFRSVELPATDRGLLEYAEALTLRPWEANEAWIEQLKALRFTSADILLVNLVAAYFNFVNRIALGLGVEACEDEIRGYQDL